MNALAVRFLSKYLHADVLERSLSGHKDVEDATVLSLDVDRKAVVLLVPVVPRWKNDKALWMFLGKLPGVERVLGTRVDGRIGELT